MESERNYTIRLIQQGFDKTEQEATYIYDVKSYSILFLKGVTDFKIEDKKEWIEASQNYQEITDEELNEWKYIDGNLIRLYPCEMFNEEDRQKSMRREANVLAVATEAERLLNTISLNKITLVETSNDLHGNYWLTVTLKDGSFYYSKRLNKEVYKLFIEILPLNEHPKIKNQLLQNTLNYGLYI